LVLVRFCLRHCCGVSSHMIQNPLSPNSSASPISETNFHIRTVSCDFCALCGSTGQMKHFGLEDKLFGAPGIWSFRQCSNNTCGLVWLDPAPLPEELPKAYRSYYTHGVVETLRGNTFLKEIYRKTKLAYLSRSLGYTNTESSFLPSFLAKLLFLFPGRRNDIQMEVMSLPAQAGGRLLDIGCGSGERMMKMRDLGWTVSGIDFDPKAVMTAKSLGFDVYCGSIPEVYFPSNSFDAIIMNHVIEHVPNPREVLSACERILKPGGKLALATPNSSSWGRRLFRRSWRGFEPPRHLYLFSPVSMKKALQGAGFSNMSVTTSESSYVWKISLMLKLGITGKGSRTILALIRCASTFLNSLQQAALFFNGGIGECLFASATKDLSKEEL
jgi:2-polyprenyl-3-methyl-5-hydroxy-6-metoxy-1,4-benzoquinol methylase